MTISQKKRTALINIFSTLGYISIVFQWLWCVIVLAHPLLSSDLLVATPVNSVQPAAYTPPSVLTIWIVVILTIAVFVATAYTLWMLPKTIGKGGAKLTARAVDAAIPIIAHHKPVTKKRRLQLSYRIVLSIKAILVMAPLLALAFSPHIDTLEPRVIWAIGLFCASCSLTYLAIAYIGARLLGVESKNIW